MNIKDLSEEQQKEMLTQLMQKHPDHVLESIKDIDKNELKEYLNEKFDKK